MRMNWWCGPLRFGFDRILIIKPTWDIYPAVNRRFFKVHAQSLLRMGLVSFFINIASQTVWVKLSSSLHAQDFYVAKSGLCSAFWWWSAIYCREIVSNFCSVSVWSSALVLYLGATGIWRGFKHMKTS